MNDTVDNCSLTNTWLALIFIFVKISTYLDILSILSTIISTPLALWLATWVLV